MCPLEKKPVSARMLRHRRTQAIAPRRTGVAIPLGQIEGLTVLRGAAAWLVVLTHCLRLTESLGVDAPVWLRWLDLGNFAVIVFFCLSGFTLALAHKDDRWDRRGCTRFLTRRLFRVYPSFLVSFVVCLAMVVPLHAAHVLPGGTWIGDSNRVPDVGIGLAYLTFSANLFGIDGYVNNVFWSLPIEFQFYLLFPLFMLLLRRSLWVLLAAAMTLAAAGRVGHWPGQTADLAWIFASGMIAGCFFARTGPIWPSPVAAAATIAAALPAVVLSNLSHDALRWLPGPLSLHFGVCSVVLVFALAQIRPANQLWRVLIIQGEISYSLYLFHTPLILFVFWLCRTVLPAGSPDLLLIYSIVLFGTWVAATAMHHFVERPGIVLGKRWSGRS